jgi:hypothetical protein
MNSPASDFRRNISKCSGGGCGRETHTLKGLFDHPLGIDHGLVLRLQFMCVAMTMYVS